jgi:gamma-glutamyltranspeptidase/glutathione hydrolase
MPGLMSGSSNGGMRGAIAAGHPLTAQAGARVLAEGGNAVDACIAAAFTAAVAEGPLTGPTGGGFLLVSLPGEAPVVLDCFFAVPESPLGEMDEVIVDFEGGGTQTFHVGEGSVAVPGLVPGLVEAHCRYASCAWPELVEPAIALARQGGIPVDEPRAFLHRILCDILLRTEPGRRVYGDPAVVATGDLVPTLERVRDVGARAVEELLPELADDLASYVVAEREPVESELCGLRVLATPAPSVGGRIVLEILGTLEAEGEWSLQGEASAIGQAYGALAHGPLTGTTHISVLDASGIAVALSSTLGSGSGIFRGGTQLNNMLGELDVIGARERAPGERLPSMMTPTLVLDEERPRLVVGSAGSVRLAGAIAQVVWRTVHESQPVDEAIDAPRIHVDRSTLHLEGGWADEATRDLGESWDLVRWDRLNLYFGGVQAVEQAADGLLRAAGDPRRGGVGLVVS